MKQMKSTGKCTILSTYQCKAGGEGEARHGGGGGFDIF